MQEKNKTLAALSSAAMLLNTLSSSASANPPDQKTTVDYRYTSYEEGALDADKVVEGSTERYSIDIHQVKVKTPVAGDTELVFSGQFETLSGASPWYVLPNADGEAVQVMTGATIDETRAEAGLDFRSYNEKSESTLSVSYSGENDYTSFGFGYAGQWRFNKKTSTLSWGVNGSKDYIDATDADIYPGRPTEETKNRLGGFVGFSQVMSKNRLAGVTLGLSSLEGYLSDAYKLAWVNGDIVQDSRPTSQNNYNASLRWREYIPKANAALHVDLGYYNNNWEIASGTFNLAWYQNIGSSWQITPSLRYYNQSAAVFYQPFYTEQRMDGFYSSDYRLSEFSAISARLKVAKTFDRFYLNFLYENYSASGDHPAMLSFDLISLGVGTDF